MTTRRLQGLFEEDELDEIQRLAAARQLTVAAWVREALRRAVARDQRRSASRLEALRKPVSYEFPAPPTAARSPSGTVSMCRGLDRLLAPSAGSLRLCC